MSHTIKLNPKHITLLRNRGMNGSVLAQKPYTFKPTSFTAQIEGLKPRTFSQHKQVQMLEAFVEEPFRPRNYCLVSAPNDGMAKLLAAWMMQYAVEHANSRTALPQWVDVMGGFENKIVQNRNGASMLILNNVGATSTQPKIEKLRDIIEAYPDIPKVVVATGADPYTFFTRYLYLPLHSLAYLTTNMVMKNIEI